MQTRKRRVKRVNSMRMLCEFGVDDVVLDDVNLIVDLDVDVDVDVDDYVVGLSVLTPQVQAVSCFAVRVYNP